jgi:hypothetical protein
MVFVCIFVNIIAIMNSRIYLKIINNEESVTEKTFGWWLLGRWTLDIIKYIIYIEKSLLNIISLYQKQSSPFGISF